MKYDIIETPKYLEDLIIYEIATKGFTSPNGAESGNFRSLAEKMPYLQELGINAIWLSGHQQCDSKHFYNIWTEYACIRPDRLDESLGTEEDFLYMVECAHHHGIKVFLDVITHGVMENSPLVQEHPDWFKGGSWGMVDYDWYGGHKDLDEWWVNTWTWYVEKFGIDGFRLDVAHYRNDLWALVKKKSRESGREIVIIAESGPTIRGVTDVIQHQEKLSHNFGANHASRLVNNVADCCRDMQERREEQYYVEVQYEDGTVQNSIGDIYEEVDYEGDTTQHSTEDMDTASKETLQLVGIEKETDQIECEDIGVAYENQCGILKIENVKQKKPIRNVRICDKEGHCWNSSLEERVLNADYTVEYERKKTALYAKFPLRVQDGHPFLTQISCHDNGWSGFPKDKNPYFLQGSRYLAGYSALLAPAIPIFMSGEEFNADYRPLPWHTPDLYGKGKEGDGKWLYGCWLDWEQLKISEKAAMLEDMKKLISIRKQYGHLIKPCKMGNYGRNFCSVDYQAEEELPIPYIYKEKGEFLLVVANPEEHSVNMKLDLKEVLNTEANYQVTTLFGGEESFQASGEELQKRTYTLKEDKKPGGGLLVLYLQEVEE